MNTNWLTYHMIRANLHRVPEEQRALYQAKMQALLGTFPPEHADYLGLRIAIRKGEDTSHYRLMGFTEAQMAKTYLEIQNERLSPVSRMPSQESK